MNCSWPVDRECIPNLPEEPTEAQIAQQQAAEDLAVQILWALSGRQFGVCPVMARPCPQYPDYPGYLAAGGTWLVLWDGASWRNMACGCGTACNWNTPQVIHLGNFGGPVQEIIEVTIAGEVLDDVQYRLEGNLLYRVGGKWPNQNLSAPLDEPGTWSVTFTRGNPPPVGTARLVGLLAAEFLAACRGGKCRLPRRVRSVSRSGVTYDMVDPTDIYSEGKTGLPEVDLWLSAVNPHALMQPPSVR